MTTWVYLRNVDSFIEHVDGKQVIYFIFVG